MNTNDLIQKLSQDIAPVQRLASTPKRLGFWLAIAFLVLVLEVTLFGPREDLGQRAFTAQFATEVLSVLFVALVSAYGALVLSIPAPEKKAVTRWLPIAGVTLWFAFLAIRVVDSGIFATECAFSCARDIVILGFAPSLILYLLVRKGAPVFPRITGALAILAGASLGCLGTLFLCHNDEAIHLLLWHLMPVLALSLVGTLGGRALLKW